MDESLSQKGVGDKNKISLKTNKQGKRIERRK